MAAGNEMTLVGNLVSDPELRFTAGGTAIASFGLAWNRRYQQDNEWQEEAHYFDVTVWREMAENVAESFQKGDRVVVVGRLDQSRWEDKETGKGRSKVGVVADEVAASVRWATAEITKTDRQQAPAPAPAPAPARGGDRDRGRDGGRGSARDGRSGGGRAAEYDPVEEPF